MDNSSSRIVLEPVCRKPPIFPAPRQCKRKDERRIEKGVKQVCVRPSPFGYRSSGDGSLHDAQGVIVNPFGVVRIFIVNAEEVDLSHQASLCVVGKTISKAKKG